MRVRHLNCATMCPPLASAMNEVGHMVAHVLVVETADGALLVDTGLGSARLGIAAADVRHIVVTDLDLDHAGGLSDFPAATVHVLERERACAEGPLPLRRGHTLGHCGVAVRDGDRWLLHAGDAYFHHAELRGERAPFLLEGFQRAVAMDGGLRLENRARLVELARQGAVEIFCAHDPSELAAAQARARR
jgi:glyoxylase-like metal-dependent hydrolase (beta-lactamase superfamily II)